MPAISLRYTSAPSDVSPLEKAATKSRWSKPEELVQVVIERDFEPPKTADLVVRHAFALIDRHVKSEGLNGATKDLEKLQNLRSPLAAKC